MDSKMKTGLIRQPAGLGDIFFTQKIARILLETGAVDQIIWPVIEEYKYLSDYLINPKITFVNEKEPFPFKEIYNNIPTIINNKELLYIPLQYADRYTRGLPVMQAKYTYAGVCDYTEWENFFEFKRDYTREKYLADILNIKEPYVLVNKNFGSKDYAHLNNKRTIPEITSQIFIEYKGFDNIFDWTGLLENAEEIHTVDTVWCYLLKKLNLKKVTVYSRMPGNSSFFKYTEDIFDKDWTYVL